MASPIFDSLNQQSSLLLNDWVANASDDGKAYTSADRSALLNQAMKEFFNYLYAEIKNKFYDKDISIQRFNDFIVDTTKTATAGVITFTSAERLLELINVIDQTTDQMYRIVDKRNKALFDSDKEAYLPSATQPFAVIINPTTVNVYPASSNAFSISYLTMPRFNFVQNDPTGDIVWNETFYEDIKLMALAQAQRDDGNFDQYAAIVQKIMSQYNGGEETEPAS